jgi:hypothetical protein
MEIRTMSLRKKLFLMSAACALAGASAVGCATTPYNPNNLRDAELARIAGICQNVMGLSPSERPTGGNWLGNDRLDYWTSHYRGCIVSLSDSLTHARDTTAGQQAEEECRAKGLLRGSPELALCVLQTAGKRPAPTAAPETTASAALLRQQFAATGSYYRASARETARREQVACAALGISPTDENAFVSCVKSLSNTFYSIDHPIN